MAGREALPPKGAADALYVFDLYGFVWRYFKARGGQRWAWRRFCDKVQEVLRERDPARVAFAVDNPYPTWRHDLAPTEWKATRPALPAHEKAGLLEQVRYSVEALGDVFGLRHFTVPGFDGDDVAATLTESGLRSGLRVVVLGFDKDFAQLVQADGGRRCVVWDGKDEVLDPDAVRKKYGVWPRQMVDWQALVGDSTDNVRGVLGVGPVGATALLQRYTSLDLALDAAATATPESDAVWKDKKLVRAMTAEGARADALRSRELVRLRRDVPLPLADLRELSAEGAAL